MPTSSPKPIAFIPEWCFHSDSRMAISKGGKSLIQLRHWPVIFNEVVKCSINSLLHDNETSPDTCKLRF